MHTKTYPAPALEAQTALGKQKIKYGEKGFSIWRMEFCHPAMKTWLWDDMPLNSPKRPRPPYWNSTSGFDVDHVTAVDMSFCASLRNFIQIAPPTDFRGPIMGSLKSPCITSKS